MKLARAILFALVLSAHTVAKAAIAGSTDPSFDAGTGGSSGIRCMAILPDNRVLVGGDFTTWNGLNHRGIVLLQSNGAVDRSFVPSELYCNGAWVQPDGKILVNGSVNTKSVFTRLNQNGSLDSSFFVTFEEIGDGRIGDVKFLPDHRLVVAGMFRKINGVALPGIAILQEDGTVDRFFHPPASLSAFTSDSSLNILPNGNILLANGSFTDTEHTIIGTVRLNQFGEVDKTFDLGTAVFFGFPIFPLAEGNFLLYGDSRASRLLSDDALDQHHVRSSLSTVIMALQMDEREILRGNSVSWLSRRFADGKPDPSFSCQLNGAPSLVRVRPDGRILIAGAGSKDSTLRNTVLALLQNDDSAAPEVLWHAKDLDAIPSGRVTLKLIRQGNLQSSASVEWKATFSVAQLNISPSNGLVQFAPGASTADVSFDVQKLEGPDTSARFDLSNFQNVSAGTNNSLNLYIADRTASFQIAAPEYSFSEIQGTAQFRIRRSGCLLRPAVVGWRIVGDHPEYELGRLEGLAYFEPTLSTSSPIDVPIFDDADAEPDRTHRLEIFQVDPACPLGLLTNASITIVDNDLPFSPGFGANGSVLKSIKLGDGGALLAGVFTHINSSSSPGLARLKPSGLIDRTFIPPVLNGRVDEALELPDGRILITGGFNLVNGISRPSPACLNANGSINTSFVPEAASTVVYPALASDGILLAGRYANFNGADLQGPLGALVRMNFNGAKDTNFPNFTEALGPVKIATLPDGRFYAFGSINAYQQRVGSGGAHQTPIASTLIRFNRNGSIDPTFHVDIPLMSFAGSPGPIPTRLYISPDGRLLCGGSFSKVNGVTTPGLVRLDSFGQLDTNFAARVTQSLTVPRVITDFDVLPNGKIVVLKADSPDALYRLNADGSWDSNLAFGIASGKNVHAFSDGSVLLTGTFTSVGGEPRYRVAWFDSDGNLKPEPTLSLTTIQREGSQTRFVLTSLIEGTVTILKGSQLGEWSPFTNITAVVGEVTFTVNDSDQAAFYKLAN